MRKICIIVLASISVSILILMTAGCKKKSDVAENENIFDMDDLEIAMKDKEYDFEIIDADKDFLSAPRKRLVFDDTAIDIYIFKSEEDMEKEAGYIGEGGCSYDNGYKRINVSWVSYPHFLKKGCLIVQYVGEDSRMVNDLEEIMGEQFAGYRPD